jgi:drug/metabolite transporter (DMT)-like permease
LNRNILKADGLLLLTAAIWGFAFVAQRAGMEYIGPFLFNAIRFALGSLCLLGVMAFTKKAGPSGISDSRTNEKIGNSAGKPKPASLVVGGIFAGIVLFLASSFQQAGLVYTSAGKAGFITGLYVVVVPVMGLMLGHRPGLRLWAGAILAGTGLYLLSATGSLTLAPGDGLVLIGALLWAVHVHVIGKYSPGNDPIKLAFMQFAICSILSSVSAAIFESSTMAEVYSAIVPLAYGGFLSVGTAFTLQVVAQRDAKPSHAAIIMSLEAVFAAVGGWLILGESLTSRGVVGCVLMFAGMLVSQEMRKKEIVVKKGTGTFN